MRNLESEPLRQTKKVKHIHYSRENVRSLNNVFRTRNWDSFTNDLVIIATYKISTVEIFKFSHKCLNYTGKTSRHHFLNV